MEQYTVYCSDEQTKRAYKLGAPIELFKPNVSIGNLPKLRTKEGDERVYVRPTAEQMIGWLIKEMKLAISFDYSIQNDNKPVWFYLIDNVAYSNTFSEPKEAILDAIDTALNYLEKKGGEA